MSSSRLADPQRLRVLAETGLLYRPPTDTLERFAHIAQLALGVPMTLVNLVDDHRQISIAGTTFPEPWAPSRQLPLTHSVCRIVVESDAPLIVSDAAHDVRVATHPAVLDLGIGAYAGIPLTSDAGPLGAFCAVSGEPREWAQNEIELLGALASAASDFIQLRRLARNAVDRNIDTSDSARAVAHDLRSPLHAVRMSLTALGDPRIPADDRAAVLKTASEQIDAAADMLERLSRVQDQLDAGPAHERIDLGVVLQSEVDAMRRTNDEIDWQVDTTGAAWLLADNTGLRRVFTNLLGNASRFATQLTRVTLSVGEDVAIIVEDDGPGLPNAAAYAHVWDAGAMFHRGRGSQTGVGLAVVRAIVEQHGGSVDAGPSDLGGAKFVVRMPKAQ